MLIVRHKIIVYGLIKRDVRSSQNCHCYSNEDFRQVANLKNSGLVIYIHCNKSKQKRNYGDYRGNNIILHNTSNRDIKRFDYIVELCQYRTKCSRCKMLIQRVRNAIDDISSINKNDIIGVCDHCKRSHQKNKCKRCEYIVEKFVNNKAIQDEKRDARFKLWLSKLKELLISVLEAKVICKHNICLDFEYKSQLYKLLNSLNSPVPMRQPEIDPFPELFDLKKRGFDIGERGEFLENLVTQLKYDANKENNDGELSFNSSGSESGCICKHFVNNKSDNKPETNKKAGASLEILSENQNNLRKISLTKGNENESTFMKYSESENQNKLKIETSSEKHSTDQKIDGNIKDQLKLTEISKKTQNRKLRSNKENDLPKDVSNNKLKKGAGINGTEKEDTEKKGKEKMGIEKGKKEKQSSEYRLMMKLLSQREKEKKALEQLKKSKTKQVFPTIKDLPDIKPRKRQVIEENLETEKSESILECINNQLDVITEMIKGTEIVKFDSHYRDVDDAFQKLPQLINIRTDVTAPTHHKEPLSLPIPKSHSTHKKQEHEKSVTNSGIIRYELSNREFIEKGWTKLPTTKIMRRMNIYKMMPSDKFDWFKNYKQHQLLFYDSGERFAEMNDAGGGKWFYKNGNIALDGHFCTESGTMKRYVIYSSGEEIVTRKKEPITILACFDKYGNGVVYDCYGNVRLKYNQSEGVLVDKNIATPGRWKWHTLNDPPILQQVFHNTYDYSHENESFTNITVSDNIAQANQEMIAIELDNFVKEQATKMMQKFKPFQIRIKVLKINNNFSLRIVDQANIFLLFRCDGTCFKINLGMLLKSDEIIDTDVAEVSEVSTPFDKVPPRSRSLINIQNTLKDVRKHYGSCKKNK